MKLPAVSLYLSTEWLIANKNYRRWWVLLLSSYKQTHLINHCIISTLFFYPRSGVYIPRTHCGRVTQIHVNKSGHHWFTLCLGAEQTTSHYLNQCWCLSIEPPGTKFCEIWIEILTFSFRKTYSSKCPQFFLCLNDTCIVVLPLVEFNLLIETTFSACVGARYHGKYRFFLTKINHICRWTRF